MRGPVGNAFLWTWILVSALMAGCAPDVADAELEKRIQEAHPAWESYQEDLKGMIGATPVAQWKGTLVEAHRGKNEIRVTFRLTGPWAQRQSVMPILLRESTGGVLPTTGSERNEDTIIYVFHVPDRDPPTAWVEIKFPRDERRLVFTEDGVWRSTATESASS